MDTLHGYKLTDFNSVNYAEKLIRFVFLSSEDLNFRRRYTYTFV